MAFVHKKRILTSVLLLAWLLISFGPSFFARDLAMMVWGWPLYFWMAAQGSILLFICIVVLYAWLKNRWEAQEIAAGNTLPSDG